MSASDSRTVSVFMGNGLENSSRRPSLGFPAYTGPTEERNDVAERSRDWFRQALHDLAHARNAAGTGYHDWACFAAQQAAEKALKALAGRLGAEAWGHSLLTIVTGLATADSETLSLREAAIRLDRYYIQTRSPNGFDDGAPLDYFLESDSREAIDHAEQVIEFVRRRLS
jgi:HEPN domain-containing protein